MGIRCVVHDFVHPEHILCPWCVFGPDPVREVVYGPKMLTVDQAEISRLVAEARSQGYEEGLRAPRSVTLRMRITEYATAAAEDPTWVRDYTLESGSGVEEPTIVRDGRPLLERSTVIAIEVDRRVLTIRLESDPTS